MTAVDRVSVLRPGLYDLSTWYQVRRVQFDYHNESLLQAGVCPDAVFIGDSITQLWELDAYFAPELVLINRGIGGDVTAWLRQRYAADALQLQPRLIVLEVGSNDLGWSLAELDDAKAEAVCTNLAALVAETRTAGIPLALCSLQPVAMPAWLNEPEFAGQKNAQIVAINANLQALAAAQGAIYVDFHAALVGDDGSLLRELTDDGVHPHALGYTIMARVLRETLATHQITL